MLFCSTMQWLGRIPVPSLPLHSQEWKGGKKRNTKTYATSSSCSSWIVESQEAGTSQPSLSSVDPAVGREAMKCTPLPSPASYNWCRRGRRSAAKWVPQQLSSGASPGDKTGHIRWRDGEHTRLRSGAASVRIGLLLPGTAKVNSIPSPSPGRYWFYRHMAQARLEVTGADDRPHRCGCDCLLQEEAWQQLQATQKGDRISCEGRGGGMLYHGRAHAKTIFVSCGGNPRQQEGRGVSDSTRVFVSVFQQRLPCRRARPGPRSPARPPAAGFSFR